MLSRFALVGGALFSFAIALTHVAIVLVGPLAYLYFGSGELAMLAARGSPWPATITLCLALAFLLFGAYGLSGAGSMRRLPLLRPALIMIGGVYFLRGSLVISDIISRFTGPIYPFRQTVFSAVSLAAGILYLFGSLYKWAELRRAEDSGRIGHA